MDEQKVVLAPDGTPVAERWAGEYECASITGYRGMSSLDVKGLIEELSRAEAQLAALQWQPITPQNLPTVMDEGWRVRNSGGLVLREPETRRIWREYPYSAWMEMGYTHFRPINPPAPQKGEPK